jgi:hypothetical protein
MKKNPFRKNNWQTFFTSFGFRIRENQFPSITFVLGFFGEGDLSKDVPFSTYTMRALIDVSTGFSARRL